MPRESIIVQPGLEPAVLPDLELVFNRWSPVRQGGVLGLEPGLGSAVPGVLFEVKGGGWEALDAKQGAPHAYRRLATAPGYLNEISSTSKTSVPWGPRRPL